MTGYDPKSGRVTGSVPGSPLPGMAGYDPKSGRVTGTVPER